MSLVFCFHFYYFSFKTNGKKKYFDENHFCNCYGNFFKSVIMKVFEHLKNISQVLWTWINIHMVQHPFSSKHYEKNIEKGAWEIINWTKILSCSLNNILSRYFTHYCMLLFLSNKPCFYKFIDEITFVIIYLPF